MRRRRSRCRWPRRESHSPHCLTERPSLASCVVVVRAVHGTIGTRVVANRFGNIQHLIDTVQAPSAILGKQHGSKYRKAIDQEEIAHHSSSPEEDPLRASVRFSTVLKTEPSSGALP